MDSEPINCANYLDIDRYNPLKLIPDAHRYVEKKHKREMW